MPEPTFWVIETGDSYISYWCGSSPFDFQYDFWGAVRFAREQDANCVKANVILPTLANHCRAVEHLAWVYEPA